VYFDLPIGDVISFVQGIGIVLNRLTPGEHMIELHAFFAQDACPNDRQDLSCGKLTSFAWQVSRVQKKRLRELKIPFT
jgi:hypothetical protein